MRLVCNNKHPTNYLILNAVRTLLVGVVVVSIFMMVVPARGGATENSIELTSRLESELHKPERAIRLSKVELGLKLKELFDVYFLTSRCGDLKRMYGLHDVYQSLTSTLMTTCACGVYCPPVVAAKTKDDANSPYIMTQEHIARERVGQKD